MSALIRDHWFRPGPVRPDGSDGYWICDYNGCGGHRGYHRQAEGEWRLRLHPFAAKRHAPSRCKPCGRHRSHTTHDPLWWADLNAEAGTAPPAHMDDLRQGEERASP